jgi:hypothetical protein
MGEYMFTTKKQAVIKTMYGEFNLGNKLQNYAVVHNLENNDFDVVTLQYHTNAKRNVDKIADAIKELIRLVLSALPFVKRWNFKELTNKKKRAKIFKKFSHNYLSVSRPIDKYNLDQSYIDRFDYVFIGSDQVWNEEFLDQEDLEFYLGIHDQAKTVGLAGSFGVSSISDKHKEAYKKGFEKMSSVSVREDAGADIVHGLIGKRPVVLIDPVMSLNKNEWLEISKEPSWDLPREYILCYFLGEKDAYFTEIREFAEDNNLHVIDIMDVVSPYFVIGPSEFIYLISKAEYVCTDSFHGCVLSLIFNKAFRVYERIDKFRNMSSRINTLLTTFDCAHAMSSGKWKEIFDWESINKTIEIKKQEFADYLASSIS